MLSNVFQTVYNLTDTLWLGRIGPEAIAAPSISWPIIFLFISMSAGLGMAGTTLVAQYTGAGDRTQTNQVAGQLLLILLVTSTVVAGAGYVFVDSVLHLMNIPVTVFTVTANYLRISFLGLPFMFMHFGFQSLLRGYGDTRTPMILSVFSAISDMILDPFFVFGWLGLPAMGAEGAAIN
jgi:putative MATE family efflux protein